MALVLAIGSAVLLGLAAVLQHRAAVESGPEAMSGRGLMRALLRRRLWVGGVAVMLTGQGLQAAALGLGRLVVVEPVTATSVLFGLPLSAAWLHTRMPRRDWAAAAATTVGLAVFLLAGRAHGGRSTAPDHVWVVAFVVVVVAAVAAGLIGHRLDDVAAATGLAVAAGLALGLLDVLIKTTIALAGSRHLGVLVDWHLYALAIAGLSGFLLVQHAYRAGHLTESMPAAAVMQPLTGTLLGITVLGEHLAGGVVAVSLQVGAAVVAGVGVVLLARSPLTAEVVVVHDLHVLTPAIVGRDHHDDRG